MPKTTESKSLGLISEFRSESEPEPLDIETRVSTLERTVNQILLQLTDISERVDMLSTSVASSVSSPQSQKVKQKSKPRAPKFSDGPSLADGIYALLCDGKVRSKAAICSSMGCTAEEYGQARQLLINSDRMLGGDANELVAEKICNVGGGLAVWTQEQVDAELASRAARREGSADPNE